MKKFLKGLLILMLAVIPFITVDAKKTTTTTSAAKAEPITFYEFYGATCPHCQELNEWIENVLDKDKDYNYKYKLVRYEVWSDQTNAKLMQDVGSYLGVEVRGVPFMVIGKQTLSGFSSASSPAEIKKYIDEAYNAQKEGKYEDVVAGVGDGKIAIEDKDKKTPEDKKKNDIVGYIITGVIAIIIIAIIFGRSKTSYIPEVEDDEEVETVEVEEAEETEEEDSEEETEEEEVVEDEKEEAEEDTIKEVKVVDKKKSTTKKKSSKKRK